MAATETGNKPSELKRAVVSVALKSGDGHDVDEIVMGVIEAAIIIRGMDLKGDRGKALAAVRELVADIT